MCVIEARSSEKHLSELVREKSEGASGLSTTQLYEARAEGSIPQQNRARQI